MPTDLSSLPPPPTGQTGVTPQSLGINVPAAPAAPSAPTSLSALPPPPSGAQGYTLDQLNQNLQAPATRPTDPFNPLAPNGSQSGLKTVANAVLGAPANLGVHLGDLLGAATAAGAGALGFKGLQQKIQQRLQQPQTNIVGGQVPQLQGGVKSAEQIGGEALQTGATAGAGLLAPEGMLASAGTGAGIGAATGAGQAMEQGQGAGQVAKQSGIGAAIGGITGGAVTGIGKLIGAAGDKIMTSVIKPTTADIKDGFSLDTLKQYNLGGSLHTTLDKTQTVMNSLTDQLRQKLGSSGATINLNEVFQNTVKDLTSANKFKAFGALGKIGSALDNLKNEVSIVSEGNPLSIPEAQLVKQASGNFGAWQYGKPDPESKASEIVYNSFYNQLKTAIENNSPEGVRDINQQLSKLIPVQNAVIRRLPVAERSNLISLNEMIGLVGTTIHPAALGPTLLSIISRSGAAGSLLSKLGPEASRIAQPAALATGKLGAQVSNPAPVPSQ